MSKRAAARERILRATLETLAGEGHAGATARAIAARGGFAPGVIYYHFADLDDLFLATMRFTSDERLARYRERTSEVANAVDLLARLRELYAEDTSGGHISAVQELIAAASTRLADEIREDVRRWQDFAEEVIGRLLAGSPLAELVPVRQAAQAAVAFYLGAEMLAHLDPELAQPESFFAAAEPAAAVFDALRDLAAPA